MKPKKHNKQKDILFVLISSFILVVLWIGFNIYHIWVTSTISEDLQLKLTPIVGSFDTATIQKLKNRVQIEPAYERQASAKTETISPTPTLPITPEAATTSASIIAPEPTISRSGQ
jgi:hypothetical protein